MGKPPERWDKRKIMQELLGQAMRPPLWTMPIMWWGFGMYLLNHSNNARKAGEFYGIKSQTLVDGLYIVNGFLTMFCTLNAVLALIGAVLVWLGSYLSQSDT